MRMPFKLRADVYNKNRSKCKFEGSFELCNAAIFKSWPENMNENNFIYDGHAGLNSFLSRSVGSKVWHMSRN